MPSLAPVATSSYVNAVLCGLFWALYLTVRLFYGKVPYQNSVLVWCHYIPLSSQQFYLWGVRAHRGKYSSVLMKGEGNYLRFHPPGVDSFTRLCATSLLPPLGSCQRVCMLARTALLDFKFAVLPPGML